MRINKRLVAKATKRGQLDYLIEKMMLAKKAVINIGLALLEPFRMLVNALNSFAASPKFKTFMDEYEAVKNERVNRN